MPDTIIHSLRHHAQATPSRTVFQFLNDGRITGQLAFGELYAAVQTLAERLRPRQLRGQRVLLVYQDAYPFIIAFLACLTERIVAVPASFPRGGQQSRRLGAIVDDAEASIILTCTGSAPALDKEGHQAELVFSDERVPITIDPATNPHPATDPDPAIDPSSGDIAFIQYTSGSTSEPKGVIIRNSQIMHNQHQIARAFGCQQDSVIFSWLPFHHDMGLIGNILHAIYIGCRCLLMDPFQFIQRPQRWLEAISNYQVTHSGGPDFAYALCRERFSADELSNLDLSSWKVAYNGSEPIQARTIQEFLQCFAPAGFDPAAFHPCYGLAEATLMVSGAKPLRQPVILFDVPFGSDPAATSAGPAATSIVSSGAIVCDLDLCITTAEGQPVTGERTSGEICIAGDNVMEGYWRKDSSSYYYEIEGKRYFRTGDKGFVWQGELFILGRIKEMLIIRGRNFYPYDLECAVAHADPAIGAGGVAVFGIHHPADAFIVLVEIRRQALADAGALDAEKLIRKLDSVIADGFGITPYDIVLTSPRQIPRTTSGKLQRLNCSRLYLEDAFPILLSKRQLFIDTATDMADMDRLSAAAMQQEHEGAVREYLLSVLHFMSGTPDGSITDDTSLTALGLDSMTLMQFVARVNRELGLNIEVANLFRINSLSGFIRMTEDILWLKKAGNEKGRQIII